jgi:hypothetical protein
MGVSGQCHAPAALYPRYPLYMRLCEPQNRSGHRGYRKNPLPLSENETRSSSLQSDTTPTELLSSYSKLRDQRRKVAHTLSAASGLLSLKTKSKYIKVQETRSNFRKALHATSIAFFLNKTNLIIHIIIHELKLKSSF